jgi:exosortase E/protease (VPEID-CTERM system)
VFRPTERIVGTSAFEVLIESRCSGYEGIGLVCAFLAVYLYLFRAQLRFPNALLIVPLGSLVIWLTNSARIAALVLVGTWGSRTVAEEGFHSQAGWMAFCGVALGLVYLLHRVPFFAKTDDTRRAGADPTAAYLMPLLVLVAASMATAAFSAGFDRLYPLKVVAVASTLLVYRRSYAAAVGWCSWHAVAMGLLAFVVWMVLEPASSGRSAEGLRSGLSSLPAAWAGAWVASRFIGFVVTVPIAEELAFRGYLARLLVSEDFESLPPRSLNWLSVAVSSVAFGALHGGRWLAGIAAGLLYALALNRRGRVSDAIIAHAITNGLIAAYVLSTGSWSLMV